MKKLVLFIILFASSLFWLSCDKEVELLADYKDITIVYGLINPLDSISYIRIEKAYLTDGNILDAAQIADSNQYPYKLDVKMKSGNQNIVFDTITVHNKEGGIFYAPDMQVYYAVTKDALVENQEYQLEITNPKSGKVITSSTSPVDASRIDFTYPPFLTIDMTKDKTVKFESIAGVRLYQLNIRFHYAEYNINTGDSTLHYVDWVFPTAKTDFLDGGEEVVYPYIGEQFYSNLLANIPFKEGIERYNGQMELIVSAADENFNTYMEVNNATNYSLVIDRPSYTNIENGYGLFASRSTQDKFYNLSQPSIVKLTTYDQMNFQNFEIK